MTTPRFLTILSIGAALVGCGPDPEPEVITADQVAKSSQGGGAKGGGGGSQGASNMNAMKKNPMPKLEYYDGIPIFPGSVEVAQGDGHAKRIRGSIRTTPDTLEKIAEFYRSQVGGDAKVSDEGERGTVFEGGKGERHFTVRISAASGDPDKRVITIIVGSE